MLMIFFDIYTQNVKVLAVENMTLEEIFLANVNHRRQTQNTGAK